MFFFSASLFHFSCHTYELGIYPFYHFFSPPEWMIALLRTLLSWRWRWRWIVRMLKKWRHWTTTKRMWFARCFEPRYRWPSSRGKKERFSSLSIIDISCRRNIELKASAAASIFPEQKRCKTLQWILAYAILIQSRIASRFQLVSWKANFIPRPGNFLSYDALVRNPFKIALRAYDHWVLSLLKLGSCTDECCRNAIPHYF